MSAVAAIYPQKQEATDKPLHPGYYVMAKYRVIEYAQQNYLKVHYALCAELYRLGMLPGDFAYFQKHPRTGRKVINGSRIGAGWELFSRGGFDWHNLPYSELLLVDSEKGDAGNYAYRAYLRFHQYGYESQCGCDAFERDRYAKHQSFCKHILCLTWAYVALKLLRAEKKIVEFPALPQPDLATLAAEANELLFG